MPGVHCTLTLLLWMDLMYVTLKTPNMQLSPSNWKKQRGGSELLQATIVHLASNSWVINTELEGKVSKAIRLRTGEFYLITVPKVIIKKNYN